MILIILLLSTTLFAQGSVVPRVFNGEKAADGQFPYICSLTVRSIEDGSRLFYCSGVILTEQFAGSAGHCVNYKVLPVLLMGTNKQYKGGIEHKVKKIIIHEKYLDTDTKTRNDIALMLTETTIKFTPKIQPIPWATTTPAVGTKAVVPGWGQTESDKSSKDLRYVTVKIVSLESCKKDYKKIGYEVLDSNMCTLENGKGPCFGDSGGPLVVNNKVVGLLSFGYPNKCGTSHPDVYASMPEYSGWIHTNIKKHAPKTFKNYNETEQIIDPPQ